MKSENEKKCYVYLLIDPRDQKVFYIGKGSKKRAEDHLKEKPSEKAKHQKIKEIEDSGHQVKIELLRTGLSKTEAFDIEAAAIDLLGGTDHLTNLQLGHHHKENGRKEYSLAAVNGIETIKTKDWKSLEKEGAILIQITRSYSYKLTPAELYDATRYCKKLQIEHIRQIRYVLAIFQGVVQEIYEPVGWFPAGTTFLDKNVDHKDKKKLEFVGHLAENRTRKKYYKKHLPENICLGQWVTKYIGLENKQKPNNIIHTTAVLSDYLGETK